MKRRRGIGLKHLQCTLLYVWLAVTGILIIFFWSEWDHSSAKQRLTACLYAVVEADGPALVARSRESTATVRGPGRDPTASGSPHERGFPPVSQVLNTGGRRRAEPIVWDGYHDAAQYGVVSLPSISPPGTVEDHAKTATNIAIAFSTDNKMTSSDPFSVAHPKAEPPARNILLPDRDLAALDSVASQPSRSAAALSRHSDKPYLFTIILSAPAYRERRDAARLVWNQMNAQKASTDPIIPLLYKFVCGLASDSKSNDLLTQENSLSKDILLSDIPDTYRALTKKVLWAFEWAKRNVQCEYVMKTDDDVFVNVHELFFSVFLPQSTRADHTKLYYGFTVGRYKNKGVGIKRNPRSKWYVPTDVYEKERFPAYNQGHGYILSMDVVEVVLANAAGQPLVDVEDAYVGVVLSQAGIQPEHNEHIHDRLTATACQDKQVILIGGVPADVLKTMVYNKLANRPFCHGVSRSNIRDY